MGMANGSEGFTKPGKTRRLVKMGKHSTPDAYRLGEMQETINPGRTPRISRLMCLAVLIDRMVQTGEVRSYAEFGRRYDISRNRVTQIMNLLLLAPDIAEEIMFLPRVIDGPNLIKERMVREITRERFWEKQREMWAALKKARCC